MRNIVMFAVVGMVLTINLNSARADNPTSSCTTEGGSCFNSDTQTCTLALEHNKCKGTSQIVCCPKGGTVADKDKKSEPKPEPKAKDKPKPEPYVRLPTEQDNQPSFGVGPLAMSVSDTGVILAGAVGAEVNFASTQWSPLLRLVAGVLDDGDKRRVVFGGDIAILHPLRGGGALDLGPLVGWYAVNANDRVLDLPTVALAARYRLRSWLYATGQLGGTVPLNEQSGGPGNNEVTAVEFNIGAGLTGHY